LQSNYCDQHGSICQTKDGDRECGKPAAFGCGICEEHHKLERDEIDALIGWIDEQCWSQEWEKINHQMRQADTSTMTPVMCVTWLSMTKCVARHLPGRKDFLQKVKVRLVQVRREKIAPELLSEVHVEDDVDFALRGLD
jgi:hypothetical protein